MDLRMKKKLELLSIIHSPSKMIDRLYLEVDVSVNSMAMKSVPFNLGGEGFALATINLKFNSSAVKISLKFYIYAFLYTSSTFLNV